MENIVDCYGHRNIAGKYKGQLSKSANIARQALIKSAGPPPFEGALCRHLCKNDSMARNGFVCINPEHLVWGTPSENVLDQCQKMRKERSSKGGKASINLGVQSKAGKVGGKVACSKCYICPHCNTLGSGPSMFRYHFDNCKYMSHDV